MYSDVVNSWLMSLSVSFVFHKKITFLCCQRLAHKQNYVSSSLVSVYNTFKLTINFQNGR